MTQTTPIYQGQDFYIPAFEVMVDNRKLGKQVIHDITQVTYRDSIEQVDTFDMVVNNWDAHTRDFKFSDGDTFSLGKRVELRMGYFGREQPPLMIVGKITALRPSFPASGPPTLAVSGQSLLHDLRGEQRSKTYENMTDSQIARQIGSRLGFTVRTDAQAAAREERHAYLLQHNEYDLVFLFKRAERLGYEIFVDADSATGGAQKDTLYFGPPLGRQVVYKLDYRTTLIEFTPALDTNNQVGAVEYHGWDNVNKQHVSHTAKRDQASTKPLQNTPGQAAADKSVAKRREVISNRPVSTPQEARTVATETNERITRNTLTGSGSTVGLPKLRAGVAVQISGVGKNYSGRYFIMSTTHTIGDGGYTTQFECRRIGK
jgi:uncharacterized protein